LGFVFSAVAAGGLLPSAAGEAGAAVPPEEAVKSLAQVRNWAHLAAGTNLPLAVEAVVEGIFPERSLVILRDGTGNAGIRLDLKRFSFLRRGQRLRLEGLAHFAGGVASLLPVKVVDNDGVHAEQEAGGRLYLTEGMHPFRVTYFQDDTQYALKAEYESAGMSRRELPPEALFRVPDPEAPAPRYEPGLDFDYYEGSWDALPDFDQLVPVKSGATKDLDLGPRQRDDHFAFCFSGLLRIQRSGVYVFHLTSDDGSQLFMEETPTWVKLLAQNDSGPPEPARPLYIGQPLPGDQEYAWSAVEGTVTFVSQTGAGWNLEISSGGAQMRLFLQNAADLPVGLLNGCRIRATGFCEEAYDTEGRQVGGTLLVPGMNGISLLEVASKSWQTIPLTALGKLSVQNPGPGSRAEVVRVRGIVRQADGERIRLEDESGSVPAKVWGTPPEPGSMVEIVGPLIRANSGLAIEGGLCRSIGPAPAGDLGATTALVWMLRLFSSLGLSRTDGVAALPVLTTAEQIRQLKPAAALRGYPVRLRGVITARYGATEGIVQDQTSGVYVRFLSPEGRALPIGSYCELTGATWRGGFAAMVVAGQASCLGPGQFPAPLRPDYAQLVGGSMDCQWVEVQGMITRVRPSQVELAVKGGQVSVFILDPTNSKAMESLSNAFVRVRGCAIPGRNGAGQVQKEVYVWVPSVSCIAVDQPPPADLFQAPLKRITELSRFDPNPNFHQMTRVRGQVLHVADPIVYFSDGANSLRLLPKSPVELSAGDLVEAVGLPELGNASPLLREASIRKIGSADLPPPPLADLEQISQAGYDAHWVRIEGRLMEIRTNFNRMALELQSGLKSVQAVGSSNLRKAAIPPVGSRLSLRGVVARTPGAEGENAETAELRLNSATDITCLELPPFWTARRAFLLVEGLAVVILLAGLWIHLLRRTVARRTHDLQVEMNERRSADERVRDLQTQSALEAQRTRIARNIHDDLGARVTKLGRLAGQIHVLEADSQKHLGEILATSMEMVEALDETVWTVNPVNDSLRRLADYVTHFATEFFHGTNIRCRLDIPLALPEIPVTAEFRFSLFLAVKEALNNVLKHSEARTVLVKMGHLPGQLQLTIQDDGRGFAPASVAWGNGLANLRTRVAGLGGQIALESSADTGTKIIVIVPLPDPVMPTVK
jgi:signal transduction histidine kinase